MPIDYSQYHPKWTLISKLIRVNRAQNHCEWCGVKNHADGHREKGKFIHTCGNATHDAAGAGLLSYKKAKELVNHCNTFCDDNLVIIVLTVAHIDHDKENNRFYNLAALCQRCHLKHDIKQHVANRKYGRNWKGKHQLKMDL